MEFAVQLGSEIGGKDSFVISSKSKKKRATPDTRPSPPKNTQNFFSRPPDRGRRAFLAAIAAALGGAGLLAMGKLLNDSRTTEIPVIASPTSTQSPLDTELPAMTEAAGSSTVAEKDKPYMGWEQYVNGDIPQAFIFKIGQELINSDYKGFPELGDLVVQSQVDYASVPQISPKLVEPVKFGMRDLSSRGALASFTQNVRGIYRNVSAEDIKSGQTETKLMVAVSGGSGVNVTFDNYAVYGSPGLRRLLTVKEISSFLYMDEMRRHIVEEVTAMKRVDVPPAELADFLMVNAYYDQTKTKPSGFGFYFDNILKILDGAGYWHTLPAYA
ncbi:MAG TPA: hypothetical protein VFG51_02275, partial [Candidatus Saccharimonadia bacterium]|nr:hypothetical protein [Candidatus Saccharimonadia bacterium]